MKIILNQKTLDKIPESRTNKMSVGRDIDTTINYMIDYVETYCAFNREKAENYIENEIALMQFKIDQIKKHWSG